MLNRYRKANSHFICIPAEAAELHANPCRIDEEIEFCARFSSVVFFRVDRRSHRKKERLRCLSSDGCIKDPPRTRARGKRRDWRRNEALSDLDRIMVRNRRGAIFVDLAGGRGGGRRAEQRESHDGGGSTQSAGIMLREACRNEVTAFRALASYWKASSACLMAPIDVTWL